MSKEISNKHAWMLKHEQSKRAGTLDYPHKMYEEILEWAKKTAPDLKGGLLSKGKDEVSKIFTIDMSDLEQFAKHTWMSGFHYEAQSMGWDKQLTVRLFDKPLEEQGDKIREYAEGFFDEKQLESKKDEAWYGNGENDGNHEVWVFHTNRQIKSGEIEESLKHELTHLTQKILDTVITMRREKRTENVGLSHPMTSEIYREISKLDGEKAKEERLNEEISKREEPFPLLNEEISLMEKYVAGAISTEDAKAKLLQYIDRSSVLQNMKSTNQSLFQKMVRELYRAFDKIKTASISKRAEQGFSKRDLEEIFKLELWVHDLSTRGDVEAVQHIKLFEHELSERLDRANHIMLGVFEEWQKQHKILHGDLNNPKEFSNTVGWLAGMLDPEYDDDEGWLIEQATEQASEWRMTFNRVDKAAEDLRGSKSMPLGDKTIVFHRTLQTTHNSGDMIDYVAHTVESPSQYISKDFLDQLTSVDNPYIDKWQRELQRFGSARDPMSSRDDILKEYLKVKEKYKGLFDKYEGQPSRHLSIRDQRKEFWKHQFSPSGVGDRPHFWEYPVDEEKRMEGEEIRRQKKQLQEQLKYPEEGDRLHAYYEARKKHEKLFEQFGYPPVPQKADKSDEE